MTNIEKSIEEISEKLDKILKLLALDVVKELQKDQDKVELLDSLGFRPVEIGRFLNKGTENITAVLSNLKKKKEKKKTKSDSPASQPSNINNQAING